jgi:MYXO-CTERM domain-containing protein
VEGSVFGSFGQRNGPTVAIDPDDHVTIEYRLGTDNKTWTQTVTSQKLGRVVSTLTSASGLMPGGGFGFATEADADSFTIDTQYYLCTEVHLAAADPAFGATGVGGVGANHGATGVGSGIGTAKNLRTPDGGLTWLVDLITLPAMQPKGTQTPAPAINCGATGTGGASGAGGIVGSGGSAGKGGSSGSGGSVGTGGSMGSAGKSGTSGSGGHIGSGGTTGVGGLTGTGGANQGSGGAVVAGSGGKSGGTGAGGATGETGGSAGITDGSTGCSCIVGSRSASRGGMSAFLMLGAVAVLARRRRNRTGTATPPRT